MPTVPVTPPPGPRGDAFTVECAAAGADGQTYTVRQEWDAGGSGGLTTACGRSVLKRPGAGEYALAVSGVRLHTADPAFQ